MFFTAQTRVKEIFVIYNPRVSPAIPFALCRDAAYRCESRIPFDQYFRLVTVFVHLDGARTNKMQDKLSDVKKNL